MSHVKKTKTESISVKALCGVEQNVRYMRMGQPNGMDYTRDSAWSQITARLHIQIFFVINYAYNIVAVQDLIKGSKMADG